MIYDRLFKGKNKLPLKVPLALFCNHTAFDFNTGRYLLQTLTAGYNLLKVFIPEHGFFAELQDQITVSNTRAYHNLQQGVKFVSLYGNNRSENHRLIEKELKDIGILIIDIQDVGSRYYTYLTLVNLIFDTVHRNSLDLKIIVVDRPNPAGRQVEGTLMTAGYASFIGLEGIPHRHGLTIGEMCLFLKNRIGASFDLEIIRYHEDELTGSMAIYPSPNLPSMEAIRLYPGLCLLEGTNISEGRGTTKPFEMIGAPCLKNFFPDGFNGLARQFRGVLLRPVIFRPVFHKYKNRLCYGCQVHLTGKAFHSLFFGLSLIRFLRQQAGDQFRFLEGPYESGSGKPAIEILAGDKVLLDFMNGRKNFRAIDDYLETSEMKWILKASDYLLYKEKLYRIRCQ